MTTLQLNRSRARFTAAPAALRKLRAHFDKYHYVRLKHFIDPVLLKQIRNEVGKADFFKKIHGNIGVELCMKANAGLRMLNFIADDPELFGWVREITGCGSIGCFTGRIYRMCADHHHDDWHNDMTENRLIAMSINLSEKPYEGGRLLLRETGKPETEQKIENTGPGDAILFRLSHKLEHLVESVYGKNPKTAYAGWFRSKPDFRNAFKRRRKELGLVSAGREA